MNSHQNMKHVHRSLNNIIVKRSVDHIYHTKQTGWVLLHELSQGRERIMVRLEQIRAEKKHIQTAALGMNTMACYYSVSGSFSSGFPE